jgi:hypothetical protein
MAVRQQIPSSTGQPRQMGFAKLRGVDFSTSPFEVDGSRAVDMKNMINDDGVNHKRQGWTENNELVEKTRRVTHTNGEILNACDIGNNRILLVFVGKVVVIRLTDETVLLNEYLGAVTSEYEVKFFKINVNKIVIAFIDKKVDSSFTKTLDCSGAGFVKFVNNEYIPTTTISINADSEKTSTRDSFEEPSLILNKRKNSLLSSDKLPKLTIVYDGEVEDEYLGTMTLTNTSSNKSLKGYFDAAQSYKQVTASLIKGTYNLEIGLLKSTTTSVRIEQDVEVTKETEVTKKDPDTGEDIKQIITEVVKETQKVPITSVELKEDTTIFVKEA